MRRGRDDPNMLNDKAHGRASEMRERVRAFDWGATPLGPTGTWSDRLTWIVDLVLASDFPMAVRWGPELIQIYNDAYGELLGDKHPKALGSPLREVYPEIHDRLGPLNEAILRGERENYFAQDHAWTIKRKSVLERANFTISYSPIPDPTAPNGIGGILITTFETTERVHNEDMLRTLTSQLEVEVQQRTRERDRIWQLSEDLLGVSNFEGYFTSVNPAWSRLLGWSEDEIKALHVSELRHPDDAAIAVAGRKRLAEGVPTVRMENRFRHRDGSWRWLYWTMTADDDLIYISGRHVTAEKTAAEALRNTEQQFRSLVAGVTDYAFIMLDNTGIVVSWNAGAARIKGYFADEIVGRHFSQFYTEEDRAAGLPSRALAVARESGKFEAEAWRVRKDGSRFWANVVIDPIYDATGAPIGFAKITRDITERRDTQEALERAQAQLAQSQKMEALGQLTGGVAHDFNNLLMIVSGQAQTLMNRLSDKKNVRSLEAILTATSRGESLTRQLLTFARRQPMDPRTVSPEWTFAAFRDVLQSSVPGNIDLRIEIPPNTGAVSIDIPEFELALVNLVVNARDAMPKGGIITVSAQDVTFSGYETPERLTGEFVAFKVADAGSGIAPEIVSKIFEPFFSTKAPGKGTGLGLSQVYGFAHQSGGAVAVASEVGRGTTITIYLPRSYSPLAAAAPNEPAAAQSLGSGEMILVVEDNPDVKEVVVALLGQLNYRAHAVDSVAAALQLIAADTPMDMILSDVVLPGEFDGLALARIVQERYPHIPILLTSGYAKALSGNHDLPILRKPYQIAALGKAIRETLDPKRSRQAPAPAQPPAFTAPPE
jgi:PAS domain S-box-containing protein